MTLKECFEMIGRGETPEEYKKRKRKLARYATERDDLIAGIEVLREDPTPADDIRREKKEKRLVKVLQLIEQLK